jgi:ribonuclease D
MHYVTDAAGLGRVAGELKGAPLIAVDTEAAGYHRYHDRICLVQLSDRSRHYLIDTLALRTLDGVGPLLEDPAIEVIFHDADYDLRLLDRDFGVRVRNLFDTKLAAQLLGEPAFGLAALVEKTGDHGSTSGRSAQRPLRPTCRSMPSRTPHPPSAIGSVEPMAGLRRLGGRGVRLRRGGLGAIRQQRDAYWPAKNTRDGLAPAGRRELHAWREAARWRASPRSGWPETTSSSPLPAPCPTIAPPCPTPGVPLSIVSAIWRLPAYTLARLPTSCPPASAARPGRCPTRSSNGCWTA